MFHSSMKESQIGIPYFDPLLPWFLTDHIFSKVQRRSKPRRSSLPLIHQRRTRPYRTNGSQMIKRIKILLLSIQLKIHHSKYFLVLTFQTPYKTFKFFRNHEGCLTMNLRWIPNFYSKRKKILRNHITIENFKRISN